MLKFLLSLHVVLGLLGISCFAATALWLQKKELKILSLKKSSFLAAIFIVLSWISGGYYYYVYYGKNVKEVIKKGDYPWAHTVFMESKEHIFLFLPFLAIALAVIIFTRGESLSTSPNLKKQLTILAVLGLALGIFITLSGAIISGAYRT